MPIDRHSYLDLAAEVIIAGARLYRLYRRLPDRVPVVHLCSRLASLAALLAALLASFSASSAR